MYEKSGNYFISLLFSMPTQAETVDKKTWVDAMETALPAYFCKSDSYFRQCFSVSASQCEETASSVTRLCLAKSSAEIPDLLVQPTDGSHWGREVGRCAGIAYEAALIQNKVKSNLCANAENWL